MFQSYPLLAVMPVIGLALFCLSHVVICRLTAAGAVYAPLRLAFVIGLLGSIAGSALAMMAMRAGLLDAACLLMLNLFAYFALAFGYFNFVNLNIASIRIRVLGELHQAGGQIPQAALLAKYCSEQIGVIRLSRLTAGNHLVEREGRYFLGPKGHFLLVARIFDLLHWSIIGSRRPQFGDAAVPGSLEQEAST